MTDYVCPEHITQLFDSDQETGRTEVVEWAMSLDLHVGDRVWLPEVGWQTYTGLESGHA